MTTTPQDEAGQEDGSSRDLSATSGASIGAPAPRTPDPTFADKWWEHNWAIDTFESDLLDLLGEGGDFERVGTDWYDCSLEIYGVTNHTRLSLEAQEYLFGSGFVKIYVNHKDGWETHYHRNAGDVLPLRGWRRKDKPGGGFFVSFWPESWSVPRMLAGLASGHYVVEPDPLDPALRPAESEAPAPPDVAASSGRTP